MLEELVGDIIDEYDKTEYPIVQREDGSYLVDGLLPFTELQERLHIPGIEEVAREYSFETTGGLLLALLDHMPVPGATVRWRDYTFEVVDMDERRIDKILISPPQLQANNQTHGVLASGAVLPAPGGKPARLASTDQKPVPPMT